MPITQLSYARCGSNGIGTGWQIVGKSLNLPSRVCTAFMQTQEIDLNAFLWQEDERERLSLLRLSGQVFFICSRHLGLGEDRRPNGISHAFILDELDALQILKCPEKLLLFNDFLRAIPEDAAFPYDYEWPECSQSMIIESTKITADLLRCVFTNLQSQRNESLCIIPPKAMRTSCDSAIIARSYMSAIMREIPFSLRQKLTFSSTYLHGQAPTVISFSPERQSYMYDCDTEAFFFPSGTGLVHNPLVDYCCDHIGDPTKIMRFQAMDDFVNDGGSRFFDQMELLLLAYFATADDAEIDSMTPQNILFVLANSVLGATQKPESDAVLQLVARIVRICSSKGIVLPSRVAKEIDQIADKLHEDHCLRQASDQYFARSIVHDNSSMFDLVLSYKTQKPLRYHAVIDEWERALQNGDGHLMQYFSYCIKTVKIHAVLIETLIATEYIADDNIRDSILAQLRDKAVKQPDMQQISFDSWLLLFYSNAKKQVDLSSMFDMFEKTKIIVNLCRDKDCYAIKSSVLLEKFDLRDIFHDAVEQRTKRGEYCNYYQNLLRVTDPSYKGIETANRPATKPWKKHD